MAAMITTFADHASAMSAAEALMAKGIAGSALHVLTLAAPHSATTERVGTFADSDVRQERVGTFDDMDAHQEREGSFDDSGAHEHDVQNEQIGTYSGVRNDEMADVSALLAAATSAGIAPDAAQRALAQLQPGGAVLLQTT